MVVIVTGWLNLHSYYKSSLESRLGTTNIVYSVTIVAIIRAKGFSRKTILEIRG